MGEIEQQWLDPNKIPPIPHTRYTVKYSIDPDTHVNIGEAIWMENYWINLAGEPVPKMIKIMAYK